MKIDPSLSATFGEIRANHFHSGLDMRTGGEIGQPIYAPADGYVSRIKVSPWGGGKTLYIDHPNGFRTVYMHLNDFCDKIGEWVYNYQYSHHCFDFDTNIAPGLLPISQGQVVAHSGNTGGSGGPHLHYEIRYAHNDQTINAQLFGLHVPDGVPPVIKGIRIYPANRTTRINGKNEPLELLTSQRIKGQKKPRPVTLSPTVDGAFFLGIHTTDQSESYHGNNGIYSIKLYIDGNLAYSYTMQTFRFEDTRAVNALMDYQHYCTHRQPYILTRSVPYMPATVAQLSNGDKTFYLSPGTHTLKYEVADFNGNKASKSFTLKTPSNQQPNHQPKTPPPCRQDQILQCDLYQLEVPAQALYTDDSVTLRLSGDQVTVMPTSEIGFTYPTPPHVSYTLRLPLLNAANLTYHNPRQILFLRLAGKKRIPLATQQCNEWLECHPRDFGTFILAVDTLPPTIHQPRNMVATPGRTLVFRIGDDLSGVESYSCYLNGKWILAEYDGKTSSISICLPAGQQAYGYPELQSSNNVLSIVLTDLCGNVTAKEFHLQ